MPDNPLTEIDTTITIDEDTRYFFSNDDFNFDVTYTQEFIDGKLQYSPSFDEIP